ncbi:hypothetical protein BJX68DRAFT_248608 [Aspergillus pseudodeflectus]|uniref:Uncharacterized protein n=1 Tax=Aspergillus pseudodeflectus TaxID=176178 RepID=A0ABR4JFF0_9EURO
MASVPDKNRMARLGHSKYPSPCRSCRPMSTCHQHAISSSRVRAWRHIRGRGRKTGRSLAGANLWFQNAVQPYAYSAGKVGNKLCRILALFPFLALVPDSRIHRPWIVV